MFVHSRALWILLLAACAQRPSTVAVAPEAAPAERERVAAAPGSGTGFGGAPFDPQSLYEGCRERVEGTETDGECAQDADCVKTGCSSELCIAKSAAAGVMSTCEVRTCFQVLEACTCQQGHCRWVVGAPKTAPAEGAQDVQ
jgi:eight-cysteine-cluster-containing protein